MKEERYLIKEAAALVGVESHVLRYWEEELKMEIHRNGMGHRYYTKKDIELLTKVRNLKDKGLQLKAIRNYLEMRREQMQQGNVSAMHRRESTTEDSTNVIPFAEKGKYSQNDLDESVAPKAQKSDLIPVKQQILSNEAKMEQFQQLMNRIVSTAIKENNDLIGKSAGEHAANAVVSQISGMTKEQEARAEERYRKLDQTLREIQKARLEAAATTMRPVDKRKQARLNRKSKNTAKEQKTSGNPEVVLTQEKE